MSRWENSAWNKLSLGGKEQKRAEQQQPFCCPQRAATTRQKKGFVVYNVGNGGILFAKHTNIILAGVSHKNHFAKKRSVGGSGPVRQNSLEPSSAKPPPSFFRQRTPFSSSSSSLFIQASIGGWGRDSVFRRRKVNIENTSSLSKKIEFRSFFLDACECELKPRWREKNNNAAATNLKQKCGNAWWGGFGQLFCRKRHLRRCSPSDERSREGAGVHRDSSEEKKSGKGGEGGKKKRRRWQTDGLGSQSMEFTGK